MHLSQQELTLSMAAFGMITSWGVWVSVAIFKHTEEIALIKKEIELMGEIKEVLHDIRIQLQSKPRSRSHHKQD